LITLVMVIFAAVNLVRNDVELGYPDPGTYAFEPAYGPEGRETLSPEERRDQQQAFQVSHRRQAVIGLVGSAATLLIAGPAYLYHWRRGQDEVRGRDDGETAAEPTQLCAVLGLPPPGPAGEPVPAIGRITG
jgi:hypothetical protein